MARGSMVEKLKYVVPQDLGGSAEEDECKDQPRLIKKLKLKVS